VTTPAAVRRLPVAAFFVDVAPAVPIPDGVNVVDEAVIVVPDAVLIRVPVGADIVEVDCTVSDWIDAVLFGFQALWLAAYSGNHLRSIP